MLPVKRAGVIVLRGWILKTLENWGVFICVSL